MADYSMTPSDVLDLTLAISGLCLTCLVLCFYGYAAWHQVSRSHMNRVSLRLLVYALIANSIFSIVIIIEVAARFSGSMSVGWCSFLGWMMQIAFIFSATTFFTMALNLQLVVVHHLNGQKMEKYYLLGVTLFSLAVTVPPYASGQFGGSYNEGCWYYNPNPEKLKQWIMGTDSVPLIALATGEVMAFLTILGHFISCEIYWRRSRVDSQDPDSTHLEDVVPRRSPIIMYSNIILRIGLYPLVSCLMNISISVLDIWADNSLVERFTDNALSNGRVLVYGLLALTDPSFIRAMQEIYSSTMTIPHPDDGIGLAALEATQHRNTGGGGRKQIIQAGRHVSDVTVDVGKMEVRSLSAREKNMKEEGEEVEFARQI
ncbi:hypothetical protein B0H14DRAFT_2990623 [Mycena olivaceomarginata]|nr:hypothetical protein B0H14DRAFT_2990623 [Mycena olivaceomarginata]